MIGLLISSDETNSFKTKITLYIEMDIIGEMDIINSCFTMRTLELI